MTLSQSDKAIAVKYLLTLAREIDEAAIDGGNTYPVVGVGRGRNVTVEFILRCEHGTGVGIDPTLWVERVVETVGGDWEYVFGKAVEFWTKRGGMPEDKSITEF